MNESFSLKKRVKSFVYAGKGLRSFIKNEHNAWIHCAATGAVVTAGFCFGITPGEWTAVIICIAMVLAAEGFNTAIEQLVNLVSPDLHPVAGSVKDIAAGAVLICAIASILVAGVIFIPYIIRLI